MNDAIDDADIPGRSSQPETGLAHEIEPTVGLAQRHRSTAERELALVDRIIILENKLAEANQRYKLATQHEYYNVVHPAPAATEHWSRARSAYGKMLKVPALGSLAHSTVRGAKRLRRGGR